MTTTTFASLVSEVAPFVPGCPSPMVISAIRRATLRACERTLLWRHAQPPFQLTPSVHEYLFPRPVDSDVHAVVGATINDAPFEVALFEDALARYPAWADLYSGQSAQVFWSLMPPGSFNQNQFNGNTFNGGAPLVLPASVLADAAEPRLMTQVSLERFIVLPLPDMGPYTLRLFYALKPSRTAVGVPTPVADELQDIIMHGALRSLLTMQDTSWQDMPAAAYHARQFSSLLTEARARINLTAMRGVLVASGPIFA